MENKNNTIAISFRKEEPYLDRLLTEEEFLAEVSPMNYDISIEDIDLSDGLVPLVVAE